MDLFIVESPSKIKKIREILGSGFMFGASIGHIVEIPKSGMNIDPDTFQPTYALSERGKEVLQKLLAMAHKADTVYLATDLDREGEAIAWHLKNHLGDRKYRRVRYSEITASAIKAAMNQAGDIDMNMVHAQECRRVMDRLVGYGVSGALNKKTGLVLSAGRVQSVALRIVVDRELEIAKFKPAPYFKLRADFDTDGTQWSAMWNYLDFASRAGIQLQADNSESDNKKEAAKKVRELWTDQQLLQRIRADMDAQPLMRIIDVSKTETSRSPLPPLTTSLLQQAANISLGMNPTETMKAAQTLYEEGRVTYLRTDSKNLSDEAIVAIRAWIGNFEKNKNIKGLLPPRPNRWKNSDAAQEAHEAIRPTHVEDLGDDIADPRVRAVYKLIWSRAVASQMSPAKYDSTVIKLQSEAMTDGHHHLFEARGRVLTFAGWRMLAEESIEKEQDGADDKEDQSLPLLAMGDQRLVKSTVIESHKTSSPSRFTVASLVDKLDKAGVGRPATYAEILNNIIGRKYIEEKDRKFKATQLGIQLIESLRSFTFLRTEYTSDVERGIDLIAQGQSNYDIEIRKINSVLAVELVAFDGVDVKITAAQSYPCHVCGKQLRRIKGKSGKYLWCCSGYPDCNVLLPDITGSRPLKVVGTPKCPECNSMLGAFQTKPKPGTRPEFKFRCQNTDCQLVFGYKNGVPDPSNKWDPKAYAALTQTSDHVCPKCRKGRLVDRVTQESKQPYWVCNETACREFFLNENNLPDISSWQIGQDSLCPYCKSGHVVKRQGKKGTFWVCDKKACDHFFEEVDGKPNLTLPDGEPCPKCKVGRLLGRVGRESQIPFWVCNTSSCNEMYLDKDGGPDITAWKIGQQSTCPHCKKGHVVKRQGKRGTFWVCDKKTCNKFFDEVDGKPNLSLTQEPQETSDYPCPVCSTQGKAGYMLLRETKFVCNGCRQPCPAIDNAPDPEFWTALQKLGANYAVMPSLATCDKCKSGKMLLRVGTKGYFTSCGAYPKCKNAADVSL